MVPSLCKTTPLHETMLLAPDGTPTTTTILFLILPDTVTSISSAVRVLRCTKLQYQVNIPDFDSET